MMNYSKKEETLQQDKLEEMRTVLKSVHQSHESFLKLVESIPSPASSGDSNEQLVENDSSMEWRNTELCTSAFGVGKTMGLEDVDVS